MKPIEVWNTCGPVFIETVTSQSKRTSKSKIIARDLISVTEIQVNDVFVSTDRPLRWKPDKPVSKAEIVIQQIREPALLAGKMPKQTSGPIKKNSG